MIYSYNISIILALTVCFSTSVRANNSTHVITMNREATTQVSASSEIVNLLPKDISRFWSKVDKNGPLPDQSKSHYSGLGKCWQWVAGKSSGYGMFWWEGRDHPSHRISFLLYWGHFPKHGNACHKCDNPACVNPEHLFDGDNQDNMTDKMSKGRHPMGDDSGPRKHRHRMARGDQNGSRKHPERLRRGDNHPARLHPERMARGDRNGSRLHPEMLKRGDDHPLRKNPEKAARGEKCWAAKFNPELVLQIRKEHSEGGTYRGLARKYAVSKSSIKRLVTKQTWSHI